MEILKHGIDVSYHQGVINWEKVKNSGKCDFAIIRCGYRGYGSGELCEDAQFKRNMDETKRLGISVGVYFFSTAITEAEAVEEAKFVMKLVEGYNIEHPLVFDYEGYNNANYRSYGKTTRESRTAMCKAFIDTVEAEGFHTLIYGSKGVIRSKFDLAALDGYGIWCARYAGGYTSIIDSDEWFPNIGEFTDRIAMWQYTSIGRVDGIKGNVDLNNMYVDVTDRDGTEENTPDDAPDESEGLATLESIKEAQFFCSVGTFVNAYDATTVFADADCTEKIGTIVAGEECLAIDVINDVIVVLFTQEGTDREVAGFVRFPKFISGENGYNDHSFQNGSANIDVYADNGGKNKIGVMHSNTRCDCAAIVDGMAVVRYDVGGVQKVGFVRDLKGVVTE